MKKALIIVDVINDFTTGTMSGPKSKSVIEPINHLRPQYDIVIATKDWHCPDQASFASQNPGKQAFIDSVEVAGQMQRVWADHGIANTWGSEFSEGLVPNPTLTILKGVHRLYENYSGFVLNTPEAEQVLVEEKGVIRKTEGLAAELRKLGVTEIDVCGLVTDWCVGQTARDGARAGFKTRVLLGAVCAVSEEAAAQMCKELEAAGVELVP